MNNKRIKVTAVALTAITMKIGAGLLVHQFGIESVRRYNFSRLPRTYDAFIAEQLARRNKSRDPGEPLQTLDDLERMRKIMTATVFAKNLFETDLRFLEKDNRERDLEMLYRMVLPPTHDALDRHLAREDQIRHHWIGGELNPARPAQINRQDSNTVHLAYTLVKRVDARVSRHRNITIDVMLVRCPDAKSKSRRLLGFLSLHDVRLSGRFVPD